MNKRPDIGSDVLRKALEARPPRIKAEPTEQMRERLAAAIRGGWPSCFSKEPSDAYMMFLYETPTMRQFLERWADDFLRCCDALDLEVIDRRRPHGD